MAENYQISQNLIVNKSVANFKNSLRGKLENITIELPTKQNLHGYRNAWLGAGTLNLAPAISSGKWKIGTIVHLPYVQPRYQCSDEVAILPIEPLPTYMETVDSEGNKIISISGSDPDEKFIYTIIPVDATINNKFFVSINQDVWCQIQYLDSNFERLQTMIYHEITVPHDSVSEFSTFDDRIKYFRIVIKVTSTITTDSNLTLTLYRENICPIEEYDELIYSKNLFNPDTLFVPDPLDTDTYTLSFDIPNDISGEYNIIYSLSRTTWIAGYPIETFMAYNGHYNYGLLPGQSGNGEIIRQKQTFTLEEGKAYSLQVANLPESATNIQIERGSNMTDYEPYHESLTTTLMLTIGTEASGGKDYLFSFKDLPEHIYSGFITIDQDGNAELSVNKKIYTLTSNISISTNENSTYFVVAAPTNIKPVQTNNIRSFTLLCDKYRVVAAKEIIDGTVDNAIALTESGTILLRNTALSTVEEVVNQNITILYELNDSVIYQTTGESIGLYKGENYITTNLGKIVNLTYPTIDVEAQAAAETFTYEVQLWTLQDNYITTLKWATISSKGEIQTPSIKLVDDGTREFSFSIPKFYYLDGYKVLNPLWHQIEQLPIEANMHKLKVIFNKNSIDEAVEEFLVTSVVETHESDSIMIDVSSEGLAFHELGKIGYKISLSADNFYLETENWFKNGMSGDAPKNNIQYWNDLVFKDDDKNWKYNWSYEVQMDWSSYSNAMSRDSSLVYEDEYVASWNTDEDFLFWPNDVQSFKEKFRLVEAEESNIYNITQDIAKTFGVYCKYKYEYDNQYHIIGRKVIYYNNYLQETNVSNGAMTTHLDLTYPYSSSTIKRTIDSTNIVTKMFVRSIDSNANDSNVLSIIDVDANRSREDYLLDFDYLYKIGTISEEQYKEISIYEAKLHNINLKLASIESKLQILQNELVNTSAKVTYYTNAIQLDQERYDNAMALRNALTGGSNYIPIDEAKPGSLMLHLDTSGDKGYYVTLKYEGLDPGSVRLYESIDYTKKIGEGRLTNLNTSGTYAYDDFNNLNEINNIKFAEGHTVPTVLYLTGLYSPWLYYDRVAKVWISRRAKDKEALEFAKENEEKLKLEIYGQDSDIVIVDGTSIDELSIRTAAAIDLTAVNASRVVDEHLLTDATTVPEDLFSNFDITLGYLQLQEIYLKDKQKLINKFEKMMGPALREGYWSPDDYKDYGYKELDQFTIHNSHTTNVSPTTSSLSFSWDMTKLFDNEESILFQQSVDGTMKQYLVVDLSNFTQAQLDKLVEHIDDFSFIYYDSVAVETVTEILRKELKLSESPNEWTDEQIAVLDARIVELKNHNMIRSFTIGAQCEFGFIRDLRTISLDDLNSSMAHKPVLIITGSKLLTDEQLQFIISPPAGYAPFIGVYETSVDALTNTVNYHIEHIKDDLLFIGNSAEDNEFAKTATKETYYIQRVFPRIFINSLKLKTSSNELMINLNDKTLTDFEDYYVLIDEKQTADETIAGYYITLKAKPIILETKYTVIDNNIIEEPIKVDVSYSLSNADVSIYLDALKIMKENAYPKVSYEINLCALDYNLIRTAYDKLNRIVHINDVDLQLQDVCGYISSISMPLDKIWETTAEIKNYETKFEDLFSTIVAQTEAMQKNEGALSTILSAFSPTGEILSEVLQESMLKADLQQQFDQGKLTISQDEGIWGLSDSGVVAFRGGGIFTATTKNSDGTWKWNTGILPSGINASLITTGQLDTNKIRIFAGDQISFQLNGDGLFAYKTYYSDQVISGSSAAQRLNTISGTIDASQYVVFNQNGLFLTAKANSQVLNETKTGYITITDDVNRVEISWEGLILRNWAGKSVFYANANTGDLTLEGTIETESGSIGGWEIQKGLLHSDYINLVSDINSESPGIILVGNRDNALKTTSWNGDTYYAYKRTDDLNDTTTYYLSSYKDQETSTNNYYVYQNQHIGVSPKYIYSVEILTGSSSTVSQEGSIQDDNNNPAIIDENEIPQKITKVYVVGSYGSTTPLKDTSNVDIEYNFDTALTASWYNKLIARYGNDTTNNYVDYVDSAALVEIHSGSNISLKLDGFVPSFSINAKTGAVFINNGTLGNFKLTNNLLSSNYAMTIANTNLSGDNRIEGNPQYTLDKFKNCFYQFTSNSAAGTFTLTNIAGGQTTFNISATEFFRKAVADAGRLVNPGSTISGTNVIFTIESGYGNKHTRTHNAFLIYRNGENHVVNNLSVSVSFFPPPTGVTNTATLEIAIDTPLRIVKKYTTLSLYNYTDIVKKSVQIDSIAWKSTPSSTINSPGSCADMRVVAKTDAGKSKEAGLNCAPIWRSGYSKASGVCKDVSSKTLKAGGSYTFYIPSGSESKRSVTISAEKASNSCFIAGTPVMLANNTTCPIEKVTLGEKVVSYDEQHRCYTESEVIATYMYKDASNIVDLYLSSGQIITVTTDHRFLTKEGWKAVDPKSNNATKLDIGDYIKSKIYGYVTLEKIVPRIDLNYSKVYNLEIEKYHTYVIDGLVVHNVKAATS